MAELTDHELLADFARTGAESAFATLVQRHINLVYSTARRFTGDDTLAADISQAVFILLARKAGGIFSRVVLTGWLYQTARLAAANALKQKLRRQNREQEAYMQSTLNKNETDAVWKQIAPLLDDAMGALRETDRDAVLLRYFQDKPLAEVGAALGLSEDAARVRVNRALGKLRDLLTKKGVTLGVTAIAGAVAANAVAAAPGNLIHKIATSAATTVTVTSSTAVLLTGIAGKVLVLGGATAVLLIGATIYFHPAEKNPKLSETVFNRSAVANSAVSASGKNYTNIIMADGGRGEINIAAEHLRLVLHTTPMTRSIYDSVAITNAIEEFGLYRRAAFGVLLENSSDPQEYVRAGSIFGMGYVGKNLPEAAPVLWNLLDNDGIHERWHIFRALENIGFGPWDLPALTRLLSDEEKVNGNILAKLVPEAIADVLQNNPEKAAPYLLSLEALLTDQNSNVQARAALALIKFEGTNNPAIFPPLHDLFSRTNSRGSEYFKLLATQILDETGPNATPLVPDLLNYADYATETGMQSAAKDALTSIDPGLAAEDPGIAAIIKQREGAKKWEGMWRSKTYSLDDLRRALQDQDQACKAAEILGAMGAGAKPLVPDMLRAMWWKDEDARNKILEEIKKIDPSVVVAKIQTENIMTGNLHEYFDKQPLTQADKQLKEAITSFELFHGWVLPDEWVAFTNKIATLNPEAFKMFIKDNAPESR